MDALFLPLDFGIQVPHVSIQAISMKAGLASHSLAAAKSSHWGSRSRQHSARRQNTSSLDFNAQNFLLEELVALLMTIALNTHTQDVKR